MTMDRVEWLGVLGWRAGCVGIYLQMGLMFLGDAGQAGHLEQLLVRVDHDAAMMTGRRLPGHGRRWRWRWRGHWLRR